MAFDLQRDELGDLDEFEFSSFESSCPQRHFHRIGPSTQVIVTCVAAPIFSSAWIWSTPMWLQPTIVGMLWASLFLIGAAAGSVRRGNAWFAGVAGCYVWLSQIAMQSLTNLASTECVLIAVCSFSAGWLVTQLEFSGRSPQIVHEDVRRYQQWTIWDLALLTTLVAVICYALPRLESPLFLLTQVGFVLLGGCLGSWVAYRWVFDDCWTMAKLITMFLGSGLCICLLSFWVLSQQAPNQLSVPHIAIWMLTGPIAVIAAQALTVLALLTAIRIDQGSLSPVKPQVEPDLKLDRKLIVFDPEIV